MALTWNVTAMLGRWIGPQAGEPVRIRKHSCCGAATACVSGARAGHQQYVGVDSLTRSLWRDPQVQKKGPKITAPGKDHVPQTGEYLAHGAKHSAATVTSGGKDDGAQGFEPEGTRH